MIANESTDKAIFYNGTLAIGDTITFDLSYNLKTVTDGAGNNVIANVSGDIGTFSIQSHPLVTDGINNISITTETYNASFTQFIFNYYIRYRGI